MPLLQPHEYKVKPGSRTLEMTAEHPIRRFHIAQDLRVGTDRYGNAIIEPNPDAHDPILYQEGHFYYENGVEIPKKKVPRYILEQLRKHPPPEGRLLGNREVRMTLEEAERFFADPSLDSRVASRQLIAGEDEQQNGTQNGAHTAKRNGKRRGRPSTRR